MKSRSRGVVVQSWPRGDGALSVVEAWEYGCVLSNGDELSVKSTKLAELCRQLCQERCAVVIARIWMLHDENELVELHRVGETLTDPPTDTPSKTATSF